MKTKSLQVVYFSPTGTTRKVVDAVAEGIEPDKKVVFDITSPRGRENSLNISEKDLLVVGVPVYMGRVPTLIAEWLSTIRAENTPTVCIVVYGNRAYENALLELKDVLTNCGCIPIAGAAFIGEHSFSSEELPTAHGRPDEADLSTAKRFGQKIREKIQLDSSNNQVSKIEIPGEYPYGGITKLWDVDFIRIDEKCTKCGICIGVCPVGAIDSHDCTMIDTEKCISCCACIKSCSQKARAIKSSPVMDAAIRLNTLYQERKNPECFL